MRMKESQLNFKNCNYKYRCLFRYAAVGQSQHSAQLGPAHAALRGDEAHEQEPALDALHAAHQHVAALHVAGRRHAPVRREHLGGEVGGAALFKQFKSTDRYRIDVIYFLKSN